jgi:RNA ligase
MIEPYPKIVQVGREDFTYSGSCDVDIEEKVDGSQISFGIVTGKLTVYSKGSKVKMDAAGMFLNAVTFLKGIEERLQHLSVGTVIRGEYLQRPRHNVLVYDRVPVGHVVVFDVMAPNGTYMTYEDKKFIADGLGLETVPLLYRGPYKPAMFVGMLETLSFLGGQKIEGVVVKPHDRGVIGKYVAPAFKELMTGRRFKPLPPRDAIIATLTAELATDARGQKAVIHLRERGKLQGSNRDIGPLMKEAGKDMQDECATYVRDRLFAWAWPQIAKAALKALPEWYQKKLESEFQESIQEDTCEGPEMPKASGPVEDVVEGI